jgi:hypothetical protein
MRRVILAVCLAAYVFAPGALHAQLALGAQLEWSQDFDNGAGARALVELPMGDFAPVELHVTFDYFWPEDGDYWELNGNLVTTPAVATVLTAYFGAGLNIAHTKWIDPLDQEQSRTRVGANVLGGLRYDPGKLVPFFELKYEIGGGEQWIASAGFMIRLGAATGIR